MGPVMRLSAGVLLGVGGMCYYRVVVCAMHAAVVRGLAICAVLIVSYLPVSAATFSLTYDEVNQLIGSSLEGLEIRLNNLGNFNGRNHYRKNSSYVRFKGQSISSFSVRSESAWLPPRARR